MFNYKLMQIYLCYLKDKLTAFEIEIKKFNQSTHFTIIFPQGKKSTCIKNAYFRV